MPYWMGGLPDDIGQGRFDRTTDDVIKVTGRKPMSMREFVK
jgi:hypothetical protein